MVNEAVKRTYSKVRIEAIANVVKKFYDLTVVGNAAAASFWLKVQAGWMDTPQPKVQNNAAKVVFYIPENGR